jgi:integrase
MTAFTRCATALPLIFWKRELILPVLQRLLGHGSLATTANYLHVRQERLAQLKSPLDLIEFNSLCPRSERAA